MAKKLRIVDKNGRLASFCGKELIFDPDGPNQVSGMTEKERAENLAWILNRNARDEDKDFLPLRVEEFEEA